MTTIIIRNNVNGKVLCKKQGGGYEEVAYTSLVGSNIATFPTALLASTAKTLYLAQTGVTTLSAQLVNQDITPNPPSGGGGGNQGGGQGQS